MTENGNEELKQNIAQMFEVMATPDVLAMQKMAMISQAMPNSEVITSVVRARSKGMEEGPPGTFINMYAEVVKDFADALVAQMIINNKKND